MTPEYYIIEVPVLCNSEIEARELQKRVENIKIFKAAFLNMLAKAYQAEPAKLTSIISSVSANPMNAVGKIGDIVSLVKKYSQ